MTAMEISVATQQQMACRIRKAMMRRQLLREQKGSSVRRAAIYSASRRAPVDAHAANGGNEPTAEVSILCGGRSQR